MDILGSILIILFCLGAEAFFSGSEIGVVSSDHIKLRHEAAKGSRGAKLALEMLSNPEWLLSTTLVGTNIAVVTTTTMTTAVVMQLFGEQYSWVAIFIAAPLIWIFGEIVPKSIFQQLADVLTPKIVFLLRGASYLFYPLLVVFSGLTWVLTKIFGGEPDKNPFTLREEIITMMGMPSTEGDILPLERAMIRRVFEFTETTAGDVMVPLIDVVGIDSGATCGEAIRLAAEKAHNRLPVYEDRIDKMIGLVNALDFLQEDPQQSIKAFMHPTRYVPGSKSIEHLLVDFRKEGDRLAVVVDEFGGSQGIVTLEDIIEEVVGEIEDEHDDQEEDLQWMRKLDEGDYLVSARVEIETLNDKLALNLPEGDYETLAGFLLEIAKDIPAEGRTLRFRNTTFTIERATDKAILEVRIRMSVAKKAAPKKS
ncbi:MAG: hemolysin family protein [Desulfobacterales bacterium]|nr:hemolysin family protein [Desulfobacterales bacterium]